MLKKILISLAVGLGVVILSAVAAALWYTSRNSGYFARQMRAVYKAGYADKSAELGGRNIAYLEGPDNGPALLLIHGQMTDKYNYAAVLPMLAKSFHVFAVDCYGHGRSSHDPAAYSNVAQGADLLAFARTVIGAPLLVSGHSSGGIIAAYLAASGGELVRGVLFEDPPFFTLSLPRASSTWNWVDLASTAHAYLEGGQGDWALFCIERSRIWSFFGDAAGRFLDEARRQREARPEEAVRWAWLPPVMNETFRAIPQYDPRFGDVFYRGEWEAGFDLAAALASIRAPVIYEKSEAAIGADGILMGATSDEEARRALGLLADANFYTDKEGHAWHCRRPKEAVARLLELKARAGM